MNTTTLPNVKSFIGSYGFNTNVTVFSPLQFSSDLLHFHTNIHMTSCLYNLFIGLLTSLGLVVAVKIHPIIAFCDKVVSIFSDKVVSIFSDFFNILINKCASYFDVILNSPLQDSATNNNSNNINNSNASQSSSLTNNSSTAQGSGSGGAGGGAGGGGKDNNKKHIPDGYSVNRDIMRQILLVLIYIFNQILHMRHNTTQTSDQIE